MQRENKHTENKISEEPLELGSDIWHTSSVQGVDNMISFRQNSVNIWLNYVPFLTLAFCIIMQPCEQNTVHMYLENHFSFDHIRHTVLVDDVNDLINFS